MTSRGSTASAGILNLRPYPPDRYSDVDLNRLTVFTIHLLNELDVPTTLENIAVANFRMFPKRFAMVGFSEYPDVTRVNRALLQLRPKYRNWATGKTKLGWQLTVPGEEEARALRKKLGDNTSVDSQLSSKDLEAEPSGKNKRTIHAEDTVSRIRASPLFATSREGWKDVGGLEVFDVLDAYTHTPPRALRHRLKRIRTAAVVAGDRDVVQFLDELAIRFAMLFESR